MAEGNSHSDFNLELLVACEEENCHWWFENPDSSWSWLWRQRGYQRYRSPDSDWVLRVDYCRFNAPWTKRTRIGTSVPELRGVRLLCRGGHEHVALRGRSSFHKKAWTLVAQSYPRGLCALVAGACCRALGWSDKKLNINGCARCHGRRIGEAQNPRPRLSRAPRAGSLSAAPLQTAASLLLGQLGAATIGSLSQSLWGL